MFAKELLRLALEETAVDLEKIARPLMRVSESMQVDEILRTMRRERQHVTLVVDEFGTVLGLVSLEDILEEIVGEFEDETEEPGVEPVRRVGDVFVIDGSATVGDVEDELDIEIGNGTEATIGGHVVELLGRVPDPGELVELEGVPFEATLVDQARILELRVAVADPPEDEEGRRQRRRAARPAAGPRTVSRRLPSGQLRRSVRSSRDPSRHRGSSPVRWRHRRRSAAGRGSPDVPCRD